MENLESESGRARFFQNLKDAGIDCSENKLQNTLAEMKNKPDTDSAIQEEDVGVQLNTATVNLVERIISNDAWGTRGRKNKPR